METEEVPTIFVDLTLDVPTNGIEVDLFTHKEQKFIPGLRPNDPVGFKIPAKVVAEFSQLMPDETEPGFLADFAASVEEESMMSHAQTSFWATAAQVFKICDGDVIAGANEDTYIANVWNPLLFSIAQCFDTDFNVQYHSQITVNRASLINRHEKDPKCWEKVDGKLTSNFKNVRMDGGLFVTKDNKRVIFSTLEAKKPGQSVSSANLQSSVYCALAARESQRRSCKMPCIGLFSSGYGINVAHVTPNEYNYDCSWRPYDLAEFEDALEFFAFLTKLPKFVKLA